MNGDLILHICVAGFHHKLGYQLEYCYPPIPGTTKQKAAIDLPTPWSNLAMFMLPDGAHSVDSDTVFFILPSLEEHNRTVYGISCYRQIHADALKEKDADVTRSSVQKSVCVLSKVPLYGVLTTKLEVITQAYFNERDFSKVEVLTQMHHNLCDLFNANYLDNQTIYAGISLLPLLSAFRHRTLVLFKLLLLERRVIFNMFPVKSLGDTLIGLISLLPRMLEEGLNEAAEYTIRRTLPPLKHNSNLASKSSEGFILRSEGTQNPSSFNTDEFGFPLSIFTKGSIFHPYLGIASMDMLHSDNIRAYFIGVTNSLFAQRLEQVDVVVMMNDKREGQLNIITDLKRELTLTKEDLRFMDFILKTVETNSNSSRWGGSDDWIRSQFHGYLLALLSSMSSNAKESLGEFNENFVEALRTKHNYRVWSCSEHAGLSDIAPKHPFSGQPNIGDVLLQVNTSEPGRKIISTFSNTGKYVSETGTRFKSSLFSWVKGNGSNSLSQNESAKELPNESSNYKP